MYKKATICRTCLLFIFNTVRYYHRDISFLIMCRKFRYQIPLLIHFLNRKLKLNMVVSIQLSITIYSIYQSQHFKLKSLIHFKFIKNSNTVTLTVVHMSCLPFGQTLANSHSTAWKGRLKNWDLEKYADIILVGSCKITSLLTLKNLKEFFYNHLRKVKRPLIVLWTTSLQVFLLFLFLIKFIFVLYFWTFFMYLNIYIESNLSIKSNMLGLRTNTICPQQTYCSTRTLALSR